MGACFARRAKWRSSQWISGEEHDNAAAKNMTTRQHGTTVRKTAVVAGGLLVATLAGTVPAAAEGSWTSHISGWRDNNESRRWTDKHADKAATTVSFSGCSFSSMDVGLHRVVNNWPDAAYGGKVSQCTTSNWGEIATSGDFYFGKITSGTVSVDNVTVRYQRPGAGRGIP